MHARLLLLAALSAATPSLAAEAAPRPQAHAFRLGEAEVIALQDTEMEMGAALVKDADPAVLAKAMPGGKVTASVNAFVVRSGGSTILVDAGYGATGQGGHLLASLAAAGIAPGDVGVVVLTHAHSDHTGGLLVEGAPAFPRAKIAFARAELPTFDDAGLSAIPAEYRPYYAPANAALKAYGDRVRPLAPGEALAEGVTVVDLAGHTPGSIGLLVEGGKRRLLIAGDLLHVAQVQFAHPEYSLIYDADPAAAARTRRAILRRAADEGLTLALTHAPFPGLGTVAKAGGAFRFAAVAK